MEFEIDRLITATIAKIMAGGNFQSDLENLQADRARMMRWPIRRKRS